MKEDEDRGVYDGDVRSLDESRRREAGVSMVACEVRFQRAKVVPNGLRARWTTPPCLIRE